MKNALLVNNFKILQTRCDTILTFSNNVFNSKESDVDDSPVNDRFKTGEGFHAVPPSYTRNYMPSRTDLSFAGLDDSVYKAKDIDSDNDSVFRPKLIRQPKFTKIYFVNLMECDYLLIRKNSHRQEEYILEKSKSRDNMKTTGMNDDSETREFKTARVNNVTTAGPKAVVSATVGNGENAVKSSACWIWRTKQGNGNPQYTLQDQGIFDSGCSRHMTGNKSFLTDYQEVDGGFVAFTGSPKGGKITRKGKIRTRKLDFEDVYFVKELKFNLFSVSQMCDKKNSVLFTKTECLVLSPDFKLLDESQVLLKVPRQNNMYSFDLKNVVPSGGLTCLFAKATIDESNLWHMRLGHINFKTMNKLVRGNLVRGLPSKLFENDHTCVACQKGKQHKASYKTKLVSSISQPLQMLHMDLFRPTSVRSINHKTYCLVVTDDFSRFSWVFFLATKDEASRILKTFITGIENQINHKVKIIKRDNENEFKNNDMNRFCGMKGIKREFSVARTPQQNGVAKTKNRTLIKAARTMLADSLLPTTFWAEAVDEGFLVGYSINSKDFRVFNTRTRKVEENLHINFLENKPNVARSDPEWLFDIDSLTKSMNYEPVTVGNQTNGDAGIETNSINNKDADEVPGKGDDDLSKRYGQEKEEGASNKEDDQHVQDFRSKLDNLLVQQKEGYANNTNRVSTVNPSISAVEQGFDNVDDQERIDSSTQDVNTAGTSINTSNENINTGSSNINTASPIPNDPSMHYLEVTGIFDDAYDDREEVGAEADLNNLETTMNVSYIPTTRIHKDHPIEQIIRDLHSAPLTRRMSQQNLEELVLVSDTLKNIY
ncbi:putative ribonuclease H-like domain-containing protein [Tanacetum coccineum]